MEYLTKATISAEHASMSSVEAVRRFNRFYTRRIGVLQPQFLGAPYSLPEARVLYELGRGGEQTATALGAELDLDAGYLSRLLQGLRRQGLVQGQRAAHDARQTRLSLTGKGRKAFAQLDSRSRDQVGGMLTSLPALQQERLVGALQTVERVLEGGKSAEVVLRDPRPGDFGWVVERHGALYHAEYGWDERFEALVAGIVAKYVENFDPGCERCWIAERCGERVGCVFLVKQSASVAKLRLLIVDPSARGAGVGRRLVEACIAHAKKKGYRKLVLWTQANLTAARAIYRKAGFNLVSTEKHGSFGARLVGEYWALDLRPPQQRRRGT
jgi:DNA-binding MarR family transcriptional regulator/N-acetylglutamate synthase-like GNAT family acetyltransferase